jgi:T4-like virus tail tube protein gp19
MAAATKTAAPSRDQPHGNANFLVEFGAGKGSGFAEVIFAPFTAGNSGEAGAPLVNRLVLRRGATGALDLYDWWNQARRGQAPPRRIVKVKLLAEDHATVVMTWRFRNVKPVSLAYSPLNALEGAVLMETIELAFDDVEMM